jgi:hypothetical protein
MIRTLDELEAILGVPRREIIDADRLLSWTKTHGGYACHEALLHDLKRALRR